MTARQTAELIATHSAVLMLFARQWCESPEDAVQDAFCKLVRLRTLPTDPIAWLFKVVRTTAIDLGRSTRRRQKREAATARPEAGLPKMRWMDSMPRLRLPHWNCFPRSNAK